MRVHVAFTPGEPIEGDVAVVVDVMRATSTIAQALASGYRRVLCCSDIDEARALKEEIGDAVLGGERDAAKIAGFDLGASPRDYLEPRAETAIMTTTNGTRAIVTAASRCETALIGSLLNLDAVAKAAAEGGEVVILCAGFQGTFAVDDAYCAGRIVALLDGRGGDRPRLPDGLGRRERPYVRASRARGRPEVVHAGEHARGGSPIRADGRFGRRGYPRYMTKVAVVGLGAMGSRIARRLLESENELVVWNRDLSKTTPLVEQGAVVAESPAETARQAEVVITMVSDPQALQSVTEGPDGVAAAAEGKTLVQMSTVGAVAVSRLASVLPEGAELLDAPVLGSVTEAESGTLKIFAGGNRALVERWTPLLSRLGTVLQVGPVGAGSAAKLVANTTLVGVIGVLGEALAIAKALGLSNEVAFDVLGVTALADQAARRRESFEMGEYPARFGLSLARKDADLILEATEAAGIELRLVPAAREWLAEAEQAGRGDDDYSAVLAQIVP